MAGGQRREEREGEVLKVKPRKYTAHTIPSRVWKELTGARKMEDGEERT
jgi:hypothetical protein